jgi:CHASE3 domain sensor protein
MKKQVKKQEVAELVVINTETVTVDDVRIMCQKIGDKLTKTYNKTADIKAAQAAVSAYGTAIAAVKAQLIYKKMTSSPSRIEFFETE